MKTFEDYFPQILAGLWVITSITVILLSVITLKAKKVKWALDLERLKNFRYIYSIFSLLNFVFYLI